MRASSLGLGLGLGRPGALPRWTRRGSVLDADFAAGRFSHAGRNHHSKAAFLSAVGGSEDAGTIDIGPHDILDATQHLANGDFAAGLSGWTPCSEGGSPLVTVVDGVATVEGNGASNPGLAQLLALEPGRAYRARCRMRAVSLPPEFCISHDADLATPFVALADPGTSLHEVQSTFCAEAAAVYIGGRQVADPSSGESQFDDFSVTEVLPFAGFAQGGFAAIVSATTPSTASGDKVVLEASDGAVDAGGPTARNRVSLIWDATAHLRLVVTCGGATQADLDLGVITPSTPFEVLFSVQPGAFRAALRGGPVTAQASGELPGIARLYLKRRNAAGAVFDGTLHRVTLFADPWSEAEFLERQAVEGSVVVWGDSLTQGAGASHPPTTSFPAVASTAYDPDRGIAVFGIGAQTSTQIAARQGGRPITVTVAGNELPASGAVAVTDKNINILYDSGVFQGAQAGWLAGIYDTMSTDTSGNWTFTRANAGDVVPCPAGSRFLPELAMRLRRRTQWFWMGRNGAGDGFSVASDVAAAVASLGHDRYLVGAILTAATDGPPVVAALQGWNADLAAAHGPRFVDVYTALREAHDGSADDLIDVAAGHIPRSLRFDNVHLNDAGYAVVGARFKAASDAMGW